MSAVPDVGGRDLSTNRPPNTDDLKSSVKSVRESNAEKVRRLGALDQVPNPLVEFGLRLETVIDALLGDEDYAKRLSFELKYQKDRATLLDMMLEGAAPSGLQVVTK